MTVNPVPAYSSAELSSRSRQKGLQTRTAILDKALALAGQVGLEGLSIGLLADAMGMSKSGVFSHFGSREALQLAVVSEYHARFEREVFLPALDLPRGLPRLAAMVDRWLRRMTEEVQSGCLYISGAVEFDDRAGPVREALTTMVRAWHQALERAIHLAVDARHLRPDTEAAQLRFELHAVVLALHHDAKFLRDPDAAAHAHAGFTRLLTTHATAAGRRALALSPHPTTVQE